MRKLIGIILLLNIFCSSTFAQNRQKGFAFHTGIDIGRVTPNNVAFRNFAGQNKYQGMRTDNFTNLGFQFGATIDNTHLFQFEFNTGFKLLESVIAPSYTNFNLRYGYVLHSFGQYDLIANLGIGIHENRINFKGSPPVYLIGMSSRTDNTFARQSTMLFTPEFMIRIRPQKTFISAALKVGTFFHTFYSDWRYGYNVTSGVGRNRNTRFIGRVVDGIPRVFENTIYISLNLSFYLDDM
jgi:hypothetical protein